jgi:hypothetical protein
LLADAVAVIGTMDLVFGKFIYLPLLFYERITHFLFLGEVDR